MDGSKRTDVRRKVEITLQDVLVWIYDVYEQTEVASQNKQSFFHKSTFLASDSYRMLHLWLEHRNGILSGRMGDDGPQDTRVTQSDGSWTSSVSSFQRVKNLKDGSIWTRFPNDVWSIGNPQEDHVALELLLFYLVWATDASGKQRVQLSHISKSWFLGAKVKSEKISFPEAPRRTFKGMSQELEKSRRTWWSWVVAAGCFLGQICSWWFTHSGECSRSENDHDLNLWSYQVELCFTVTGYS